jgi:PAS domain S-box-containing protein
MLLNDEVLYKTILDNVQDGIYCVDLQRRIIYWNRGAERLACYKEADIKDKFCFSNLINHVDDNGNVLCVERCPLVATMEDGQH